MDVWYVSYGSNICEDRFLCYIYGGTPEGSEKREVGCHDKTPPKRSEKAEIPYPLYFAKEKSKWGKGGVAFIGNETKREELTIARKYLITAEQFCEVVEQENNNQRLDIDVNKIISEGHLDINAGWYGRLMYLGDKNGNPMFTFTNTEPMTDQTFTIPPSTYLSIIGRGLLELGLTDEAVAEYFLLKRGIKGKFTKESLYNYIFR
ncbi:hypothetical protein [Oceanobacillus halotolerans]|uniref:hypothetical protein n=1 Tax=Oceanobacillus halotolerans TaxID=2663380 RepID=UPI0013DD6117|nr:hypothetical protein [Oceanobacillus halotolerans]